MKLKWKGILRVLGIIIPAFILMAAGQIIANSILDIDYLNKVPQSPYQRMWVQVANTVSTFITLWLFVVLVNKESFRVFGLRIRHSLKDILIGVVCGVLIIATGVAIIQLLGVGTFTTAPIDLANLFYTIIVFLLVGVNEEVMCRGYIQRNLELSFNKYIALLVASVFFASIHLGNPNINWFGFTYLILAGVALGWWYMETKNLWFPIAFHFSWNFFQSLFGFNVSGQDFYGLYDLEFEEANIYNGGYFGFEGSIWAMIGKALIILFTVWYLRKHPEKKTTYAVKQSALPDDQSH